MQLKAKSVYFITDKLIIQPLFDLYSDPKMVTITKMGKDDYHLESMLSCGCVIRKSIAGRWTYEWYLGEDYTLMEVYLNTAPFFIALTKFLGHPYITYDDVLLKLPKTYLYKGESVILKG